MLFRIAPLVTAWVAAFLLSEADNAVSVAQPEPNASVAPAPTFPQPAGWPKVISSTMVGERVGPGVLYERWMLTTGSGPLEVSVATIDLRNPNVALAVTTQHGVIIGKGERLTSMADRLNAELAVNADYFDINESGSPLNLVAIEGRVIHQPDSAAAFVVNGKNQIQMGPMTWSARIASAGGATRDITRVNDWSPSVSLALLTPELGIDNAAGATEMLLAPSGVPGQYRITTLNENLSRLHAPAPGELAVAAHAADALALAQDFHAGDVVTVTTQSDPALDGMKLGVGGGPLLVRNGQPVADPAPPAPEETDVRNPVTGAGTSAGGDTLWLVVVDGRAPATSIGLTRPQLASLFIALGANSAMAFDSGGSSEMVVRRLGDPYSSVANTPSDGRERSIADGLVVINTATPGPPVGVVLKAKSGQVLVGSKLDMLVRAVDANEQPISVRTQEVAYRVDPTLASIDSNGTLTALRPGLAQLSVTAMGAQGAASVRIVPAIDDLRIVSPDANVPPGGRMRLFANALTRDGQTVAVDAAAIRWSQHGGGGHVLPDGTFVAGSIPARTIVTAQAGGASATTTVLSGDHPILLQVVPQPGATAGAWRYSARPLDLPGAVDDSAAPDGSPALRLAYDFSGQGSTRAAYAETTLTLPGEPIAFSIDVYGDKNGEWLRGGYRNTDGNNESLTIARHVDWKGWKTIRVAIPRQAAWPIVWIRLYAVERSKDAREQGSLWFRNFVLFFAGPA